MSFVDLLVSFIPNILLPSKKKVEGYTESNKMTIDLSDLNKVIDRTNI